MLNSSQRGLRSRDFMQDSQRIEQERSFQIRQNPLQNLEGDQSELSRTNLHAFENNEGLVTNLERRKRKPD